MKEHERSLSAGTSDIAATTNPVENPGTQSMENLSSIDYLNTIKTQIDHILVDNMLKEDICRSVPWGLNDVKKALMSVLDSTFESQFGNF